jgi:hypothetical protein
MSKVINVHKDGEEGIIQVDARTGNIVTDPVDRPDWAAGLAVALLQERITFYEGRLGAASADFETIKTADTINFEDLSWLGASQDEETAGDATMLQCEPDFRQSVLAKVLNIDLETGDVAGTLAERELSVQNIGRTQAEINEMEDAVRHGFDVVETAEHDKKQATGE